ncbi:imidazolonepropionase [Thermocladium modestius]|uniref:imidazolonepropionase n=1 Tax=Thermocladium modestius TaxID=62609 RepID=UPI00166572C2|nr:imidazolonepropionase [Thermocladium modestius]
MIDLLIDNIGVLATARKSPWRFGDDVFIMENAAVAVSRGEVLDVGPSSAIRKRYRASRVIDARNRLVTPALVDAHTHMLFAGDRSWELKLKLGGVTYGEILRRGGGIYSTIESTEAASDEELMRGLEDRVGAAIMHGAGALEVKTGYAAAPSGEARLLNIIRRIKSTAKLVDTLLMHVPPRGRDREAHVDAMIEALPQLMPSFVDVFCDDGAFTVDESKRFLSAAARLGIGLRLHADELANIGCSELIGELSLSSIDHLLKTPGDVMAMIAKSRTAAVLLPCTALSMMSGEKPRVDVLRREGGIPALGTDFSPNSWCPSMEAAMELSTYLYGLTPLEALMAATTNSAYSLGLKDVGVVAPGSRALLAIWKVNDIDWLTYWMGGGKLSLLVLGSIVVEPKAASPAT